jgi:hypothetical protein
MIFWKSVIYRRRLVATLINLSRPQKPPKNTTKINRRTRASYVQIDRHCCSRRAERTCCG